MNYKKEITSLKRYQNIYVQLQKKILQRVKQLDKAAIKHIKKRWKEEFPGVEVDFLTGFEAGSLTNKWKPDAYFYRVSGLDFDCYYKDGKWYKYDDDVCSKVVLPFPATRLKKFLKEVGEELGICLKLSNY
jgi:hypothetical protein